MIFEYFIRKTWYVAGSRTRLMKLPITSFHEEMSISIVHSRVNMFCRGSLPETTFSVLIVSQCQGRAYWTPLRVGGITLNFLHGPKAKDATAPGI